MKASLPTAYLMIVSAAMVLAPAHAQGGPNACTNAGVAGTYTVTCSGFTAAGPAASLVPMMQVGLATGDADGNWSGTVTINIGGQTVIPASDMERPCQAPLGPDGFCFCSGRLSSAGGKPAFCFGSV